VLFDLTYDVPALPGWAHVWRAGPPGLSGRWERRGWAPV
jgi:hypothetical protein